MGTYIVIAVSIGVGLELLSALLMRRAPSGIFASAIGGVILGALAYWIFG